MLYIGLKSYAFAPSIGKIRKTFDLSFMTPGIATYLEFARQLLAPLPGIYEKLFFGTPAFYVGKFLLSRVREDGETITIQTFER